MPCFLGIYVCLTSVVLADMVGVKRLSNAFGMILLFVGIGTIVGPPMAGMYIYYIAFNYLFNYLFYLVPYFDS